MDYIDQAWMAQSGYEGQVANIPRMSVPVTLCGDRYIETHLGWRIDLQGHPTPTSKAV